MANSHSTVSNLCVDTLRSECSSTREGLDFTPHACGKGHHSPDLCYPMDSSPRVNSPSNEFGQLVQQEQDLLSDFNRLKDDYRRCCNPIYKSSWKNPDIDLQILLATHELYGIMVQAYLDGYAKVLPASGLTWAIPVCYFLT
ncbi:hypothetical protein K435DRAFT_868639 [Dendrothele bispora CBS 962.96]|uniref:Uncharacterized protein n=1 Tax=Dendrothele bispora (strain CBS 962.96) TaxID=1314807 RepID=A0A4S8LB70_DENBC|nr:hypothetical protein K435DRAFT_868639 [Dendrothele bispora CBS 962.96]